MIETTLVARAERIRQLIGTAQASIIEIGQELIAAKAECRHGEWMSWLKTEFDWCSRTAEHHMNVARKFETVANLPDLPIARRALYALASSSVPQDVSNKAIARAQAGEHITEKVVAAMIGPRLVKRAKVSPSREAATPQLPLAPPQAPQATPTDATEEDDMKISDMVDFARTLIRPLIEAGKPVDTAALAKQYNSSETPFRTARYIERGRMEGIRFAQDMTPIDTSGLPAKQVAQLARMQQRLMTQFEERVRIAAVARADELIEAARIPAFLRQFERVLMVADRGKPLTEPEWKVLMFALHPDQSTLERRNDAFNILIKHELVLRPAAEERKRELRLQGRERLPTTIEELMAMRRKPPVKQPAEYRKSRIAAATHSAPTTVQ